MAAAYAELSDFEAAVPWQTKAVAMPQLANERDRRENLKRLELYKSGKAYYEEVSSLADDADKPSESAKGETKIENSLSRCGDLATWPFNSPNGSSRRSLSQSWPSFLATQSHGSRVTCDRTLAIGIFRSMGVYFYLLPKQPVDGDPVNARLWLEREQRQFGIAISVLDPAVETRKRKLAKIVLEMKASFANFTFDTRKSRRSRN